MTAFPQLCNYHNPLLSPRGEEEGVGKGGKNCKCRAPQPLSPSAPPPLSLSVSPSLSPWARVFSGRGSGSSHVRGGGGR